MSRRYFTSESVTEGHPDKVSDLIADSILDAHLEQDPLSRLACEVLCKGDQVHVAGEIASRASVDIASLVRTMVANVGYTDPTSPFCASTLHVTTNITRQSPEIARGVGDLDDPGHDIGAGDQGIMFGYATDATPSLMPLPIHLAHRLSWGLAQSRRHHMAPWLRPDGKTQVTVRQDDGEPPVVDRVVVSTQHAADIPLAQVRDWVARVLVPIELGEWYHPDLELLVNPAGSFVQGGPAVDCGVTGRKIIVDTYGGTARHGGGAFSGKDATKVDRSAAYFCRYVARQIVQRKLARRVELQVSYAIGRAKPLSLAVDTFGTGDEARVEEFANGFDFRPRAIVEQLSLLRPIYRQTTNYGHFGRPGFTWEA
ncbi:MAG: hypothetical protein RL219_102 [Actinomycetota bacterium]|jgi:S-adenosylmethionine synthetase